VTGPGRTLSRDFKDVRRNAPGSPVPFNGWTGLAIGLAIGLGVALVVHLKDRSAMTVEPVPEVAAAPASAQAGEEDPAAAPDSGASYDFYKMLPEQEVEVPPPAAATGRPLSTLPQGEVVLQAGSFKSQDQADKLKGRLAMYGIEANIQRFALDDETWYRVRIGPIGTVEELEEVRAKLAEAEVEATPMSSVAEVPPN
jgi:cell division protein FtsN